MGDPRRDLLALPLDDAIREIARAGGGSRVVPYVPPRAGEPAVSHPALWRVAAVRETPGGGLDLIAVPAGAEAARLGGERVGGERVDRR